MRRSSHQIAIAQDPKLKRVRLRRVRCLTLLQHLPKDREVIDRFLFNPLQKSELIVPSCTIRILRYTSRESREKEHCESYKNRTVIDIFHNSPASTCPASAASHSSNFSNARCTAKRATASHTPLFGNIKTSLVGNEVEFTVVVLCAETEGEEVRGWTVGFNDVAVGVDATVGLRRNLRRRERREP